MPNRKEQYKNKDLHRATTMKQKARYYDKTENAPNAGQRWTEKEDKIVEDHLVKDSQIAVDLKRSVGSIQTRRSLLKGKRGK